MIIESAQNKVYKNALLLKEKKNRRESGLFLVEGQKQTAEIDGSWNIRNFFISESFQQKHKFASPAKTFTISDKLFKRLSSTQTPQGIIAVAEKKTYDVKKLIKTAGNGFFVILEQIQDPGNLGTVIRCADAFGAKAVFVSKGSADIYSDKTMRSAMGSIFHLPVADETDTKNLIGLMKEEGVMAFAASLEGGQNLQNFVFPQKSAVIIGNEAKGLSPEIQKQACGLVKIYMPGKAESLNAAVAAAIIMYETAKKTVFCIKRNIFM